MRRSADSREFLIVRRPLDDDSLPGEWGLPAVTLQPGELPEAALQRLGREKLGVQLKARSMIGADFANRGSYSLVLMDIEAVIVSGEPDVNAARTSATRYIDAQWVESPDRLRPAAEKGSLCCAILLRHLGTE